MPDVTLSLLDQDAGRYRIEASAEQVDQALARYAGRRHTRMTVLRQTPARKKY